MDLTKYIYNKNEIDNIKRLLKILVELQINNSEKEEEDKNIKKLGSIINWIEVYTVEIASILKMYSSLYKIVGNAYEQIIKTIEKKLINFEISERNPEHKSLVNKAFFIGLESLLRVVTSNEKVYINLKRDSDKFFELLNINKQLHQDGLQLNISLSLFSKEVFSLEEILIIIKAFKMDYN